MRKHFHPFLFAESPFYFEAGVNGGWVMGIMPARNSVEELLDAQAHPERHQNLMVKVCGFSARFVSLSKRFQDEVIARHRLR